MNKYTPQAKGKDVSSSDMGAPITTNEALNAITKKYRKAEFLAVDTEFLRERTYYPKLCPECIIKFENMRHMHHTSVRA